MRPRRCLLFPFNSTSWFFRALRLFRDGAPIAAGALICRRKRQIKKPRRGGQPRGGVLWALGRSEGHTFHRADLGDAFIKERRRRFDSRLWNPEIALSTLTSSH